jgi:hypothetical protein
VGILPSLTLFTQKAFISFAIIIYAIGTRNTFWKSLRRTVLTKKTIKFEVRQDMKCTVCGAELVENFDSTYFCEICGHDYADFNDEYEENEFDFDGYLEPEDEEFDCGFSPGLGCSLIGSEECDFECPYRDDLFKHPDYPNV